ncbi:MULTISPECIES: hypothetical protein [Mycetocola]|uniref:hypothetical protein n=1 Tax=Mycetocola TaxID=76634 RepID=UPI0004BE5E52|nr:MULTISPECIES: hypothetical protein [Mycetocola]
MNVSAQVDVVVAAAATSPAAAHPDPVAEPARRVIVLAPNKTEGYDEARALGIEPVAVVTPRSPHGARGLTADRILETSNLTPELREALMRDVSPALVGAGPAPTSIQEV